LIDTCRPIWERIQANELPEPVQPGDAALIYKRATGAVVEASDKLADIHNQLMNARSEKKAAETHEEILAEILKAAMRDASELRYKGRPLATWKNDKAGEKFDTEAFAAAHPDLYFRFLVSKPGARKFLPKSI
jgi:hypothetical protein